MKKLLSLEELAQLVFVLYLLFQIPNHIRLAWLFPVFFLPDIFAIGFLINNKLGTILYNFSHHKLIAITLIVIGLLHTSNIFLQAGYIVYAHICFDRFIGYGLKYMGTPNKTHLGFIGKEKSSNTNDTF
jgi:hypothetical protein